MEREKNVTERYRRMLEESKTPLAIAQVGEKGPVCVCPRPHPPGLACARTAGGKMGEGRTAGTARHAASVVVVPLNLERVYFRTSSSVGAVKVEVAILLLDRHPG